MPGAVNDFCPVCLNGCTLDTDIRGGASLVICPLCGKFRFGDDAQSLHAFLQHNHPKRLYKISYHLRAISEEALGKRDNSYYPVYTTSDFTKMTEAPELTVAEKSILLLKHIARRSSYPGHSVSFFPTSDYSVMGARTYQEAYFHIGSLVERGQLKSENIQNGSMCTVTAAGWNELDRIAQSGIDSPNGFIAMWFDPRQNEVEEAIRGAVNASGYEPIRIDKVEHVNRIDDEIVARIRQSRFLVADLTGGRAGVYFEAGLMIGLGRPVYGSVARIS